MIGGQHHNFFQNLSWHSGWLVWCLMSFPAIFLARRYPIGREDPKVGLLKHFGLGFAVVLINLLIEFLFYSALSSFYETKMRSPTNFLISLIAYRSHLNLVIYWAIVGATNAYDYYIKFRQSELISTQLEAKLVQSELQSLKMQLHPHFLFNTHHSIIALMLQERNQEAIKMLTQLSDLLRMTLEKKSQQLTSLKEEVETLDLYLNIQKVRFEDRLEITKHIDSTLLDSEVPYMILQPIAENALLHGIEHLAEDGKLEITAKDEKTHLLLTIQDNGPGFDSVQTTHEGNSIGLQTTTTRLQQLYGADQTFSIGPASYGKGTLVSIRIPLQKTGAST